MFLGERMLLQAEIIAIGNEIISGLIQDTNGRYLSQQLHLLGIDVSRITAVGDDKDSISRVVEGALGRVVIVIITGGLGSTHDDITKKAFCELFADEMFFDETYYSYLQKLFTKPCKYSKDSSADSKNH